MASAPLAWTSSRQPSVILVANVFSVLGLRPLYGLLAGLLPRLRPLKIALCGMVVASGLLLLREGSRFPGPEHRLPVLLGIVLVGVLASLMLRGPTIRVSPPVQPFDLRSVLFQQARRIVVTVVGFSLILVGLVLLLLPGPGLLSILGGLAVLSVEFVWEGRLLRRARRQLDDTLDWLRDETKKPPNHPKNDPGIPPENGPGEGR